MKERYNPGQRDHRITAGDLVFIRNETRLVSEALITMMKWSELHRVSETSEDGLLEGSPTVWKVEEAPYLRLSTSCRSVTFDGNSECGYEESTVSGGEAGV